MTHLLVIWVLAVAIKYKTEHKRNAGDTILSVFTRWNTALKSFVSGYVVNSQDVDDICQETFLRTYKSSLQNEIKQPKSFMFRVAKNLIVSDYRKASTQLNDYVEDINIVATKFDVDNLESDVLAKEKLGVMCDAIASLPNKCRQAVVMRKVYGLSTREIAQRMGITTSTVSNYITRGMCAYNEAVTKYNKEQDALMPSHNKNQVKQSGRTL